jgi:large subunit ribosomal protein L23
MPTTSADMNLYRSIILQPVVTEKSMTQAEEQRKYHFKVHPEANKIQVRQAIEALFNVHVVDVNTMNVLGKSRRRSYRYRTGKTAHWKKAIVTLARGESIDVVQTA